MLWRLLIIVISIAAACSASAQTTPVMSIYGIVSGAGGEPLVLVGHQVVVRNATTGAELVSALGDGGLGSFDVLFVDFAGSRAAAVGDLVLLLLRDPSGAVVIELGRTTLSAADVNGGAIRFDTAVGECSIWGVQPAPPWSPGDAVTVSGENFLAGTLIRMGGRDAQTFGQTSASEIVVLVPDLEDGHYPLDAVQPTGSLCQFSGEIVRARGMSWGTLKAAYCRP